MNCRHIFLSAGTLPLIAALFALGNPAPCLGADQPAAPQALPAFDNYLGTAYSQGAAPQLMDIYTTKDTNAVHPALVYIHGGGWRAGDRGAGRGFAPFFTQHGYVFCSIDYRLSQVAKYPAQLNDCKCAIRFLRANAAKYHIDPKRIGVWGDSAGGHLVSLLGTTAGIKRLEGDGGWANESSAVEAVVDWYGPSDLRADSLSHYENDDGSQMVIQMLGGTPAQLPDLARDASPLAFVSKSSPPFLIEQGDADTLSPRPNRGGFTMPSRRRESMPHYRFFQGRATAQANSSNRTIFKS